MNIDIDMQVEHLDAAMRQLQDIHEDLKKEAATSKDSFSNYKQPTPLSFDWWAQVEMASSGGVLIADLEQAGKMTRKMLYLQCLSVRGDHACLGPS